MGPDELLTGKNNKVLRGKCIALPDAPDYIVKPLAPQHRCVQRSLESFGIRKVDRGGGSIVKTR